MRSTLAPAVEKIVTATPTTNPTITYTTTPSVNKTPIPRSTLTSYPPTPDTPQDQVLEVDLFEMLKTMRTNEVKAEAEYENASVRISSYVGPEKIETDRFKVGNYFHGAWCHFDTTQKDLVINLTSSTENLMYAHLGGISKFGTTVEIEGVVDGWSVGLQSSSAKLKNCNIISISGDPVAEIRSQASSEPSPTPKPTPSPTTKPMGTPIADTGGGPITSGEIKRAAIDFPKDTDEWTFDGTAGQLVTIAVESSELTPFVNLLSPTTGYSEEYDYAYEKGSNVLIDRWRLLETGTYTIEIYDNDREPGNYSLQLTIESSP